MAKTDDEDDLRKAAAIAAVYALMAQESSQTEKKPVSEPAGWARASLFEQVKKKRIVAPDGLKHLTVLALALSVCLSCIAPCAALERIEYECSGERPPATTTGCGLEPEGPPVAPDIRTNIQSQVPRPAPPLTPETASGEPVASPPTPRNLPQQGSDMSTAPVTALTPASAPAPLSMPEKAGVPVRVGIALRQPSFEIATTAGANILDEYTGELVARLPGTSSWLIQNENGDRIVFQGKNIDLVSNPPELRQTAQTPVYKQAAYIRGQAERQKPATRLVKLRSTDFSLPVRRLPPPEPGEPLREVAFIQPVSPASLPVTASPAKAKAPVLPPLPGYVIVPSDPATPTTVGKRSYRGKLTVRPGRDANDISLINTLDLEEYLLSVVPSEMPSQWPMEALKAQAIAARSYAVTNLGKHRAEGFDVKATTEDQVYLGSGTESPSTFKAVTQTHGLVMTHGKKPVTAFFHSSSGGLTETSEHVYSKSLPFLKSVVDFDHNSPHANWTRTVPAQLFEEALVKLGKNVGCLLAVLPINRTPTSRIKDVLVAGSASSFVVSGDDIRRMFTLPSTLFEVMPADDAYTFAGKGFGHGLGMSQWGAKHLAEQGYNAGQILSYYYNDVSLEPFAAEVPAN